MTKSVTVVDGSASVSVTEEEHTVTLGAIQGPQGPPGPPGSGGPQTVFYTAGEDISGHRVVRVSGSTAYYADSGTPSHINTVVGISTGAAASGNTVTVQVSGELTEPSWTWSPGAVFLGVSGQLTQTPPATGLFLKLGKAMTPTTLLIDLQPAITR